MIATCEGFGLAEKLGLAAQSYNHIAFVSSGKIWSMTTYSLVPGVGPDTPADHEYQGGFASALMISGP